jgi:hypothetical protein
MSRLHHEVPTHLNVEDRVLFGLTVRQFLYLLVGSSAAYALWDQPMLASSGVRACAAAACVLVTLAFALLRPGGRALEEWLVSALFFLTTPRCATWRPPEPDLTDWRPATGGWQELAPSPLWAEGDVA